MELYKLAEIISNSNMYILFLIISASLYKQFHTCRAKKACIISGALLKDCGQQYTHMHVHAIDKDYVLKHRDMYSFRLVNCNL